MRSCFSVAAPAAYHGSHSGRPEEMRSCFSVAAPAAYHGSHSGRPEEMRSCFSVAAPAAYHGSHSGRPKEVRPRLAALRRPEEEECHPTGAVHQPGFGWRIVNSWSTGRLARPRCRSGSLVDRSVTVVPVPAWHDRRRPTETRAGSIRSPLPRPPRASRRTCDPVCVARPEASTGPAAAHAIMWFDA